MIFLRDKLSISPEKSAVEMVERKGIGHPDTLADMVAEDFSYRYSRYCLDKFGIVPNHWVDKVTLAGASASLGFNNTKMLKPIRAYLFGRVTESIGDKQIEKTVIFKETIKNVISKIFGTNSENLLANTEYLVDTNWTTGSDHPKKFYFPQNSSDIKNLNDTMRANDSVICSSFAPYTLSEELCIDLENYTNSKIFKKSFSQTGYDIKVMIIRIRKKLNITICVPFISSQTNNLNEYKSILAKIKLDLEKYINNWLLNHKTNFRFKLFINTKDFGKHVYLTAFGTALDKGDYGAVGRGNRFEGVISTNRGTNVEAVNGKNSVNHSGKIYTILSNKIAWKVYEITKQECIVNISVKNGDSLLKEPKYCIIRTPNKISLDMKLAIEDIVKKYFKEIPDLYKDIIKQDVVKRHIDPKLYLNL